MVSMVPVVFLLWRALISQLISHKQSQRGQLYPPLGTIHLLLKINICMVPKRGYT